MDDIVINTVTGEFQLNKKMIEAMYVPKDDLRKLAEEWKEMSNGKDYYDSGTFADRIEELIGGE